MTREEAIELAGETVDNLESVSLVMDIYDDLEAMTCENCKHYEEINDKCNMGVETNCRREVDADFGCNKFVANAE